MENTDEMRATPTQMQRQHVFVVNGSPDFLDLMRVLLQEERYNVTTTNFVPNTFEHVAAAAPSLLIVDLAHGERAGWELLAELRRGAATAAIPVIVVSTTPRLLEQAKAAHAAADEDCYLLKPFDLDEMLGMVEQLIGTA